MRAIHLLGAPSSAGAFAPGQEKAPRALRDAGLVGALERQGFSVVDLGDGTVRRWSPDPEHPRAQNVAQVAASVAETEERVADVLSDDGLILVLGGDCTTGAASIQALVRRDTSAAVLYVDLDADMNTPESNSDGALDWMGVGMLLGLPGAVHEVVEPGILAPDRIVLVGFDGDRATPWEAEQFERLAMRAIGVDVVAGHPAAAARGALAALPADAGSLAVHFDVDVIDFNDAPLSEDTNRGVGVPLAAAVVCVGALVADPRVRVLTITELNPDHGDPGGATICRFVNALAEALGSAR